MHRTPPDPGTPRYVGESRFLHYLPPTLLGAAVVVLLQGALLAAAVIAFAALGVMTRLPWRFELRADGIDLCFGLHGDRFIPREHARIRADLGGAVVFPANDRRGYPLTSGLVEHDRSRFRHVVSALGFDLVD